MLEHLKARDVTMICISRAPIDKLLAYRKRMGWNFKWASSYESDFNYDFERRHQGTGLGDGWTTAAIPSRLAASAGPTRGLHVQGPGLSVFTRSNGDVYLTYSTTARGLEPVMVYYGILDRVPVAATRILRVSVWWLRRHDESAAHPRSRRLTPGRLALSSAIGSAGPLVLP